MFAFVVQSFKSSSCVLLNSIWAESPLYFNTHQGYQDMQSGNPCSSDVTTCSQFSIINSSITSHRLHCTKRYIKVYHHRNNLILNSRQTDNTTSWSKKYASSHFQPMTLNTMWSKLTYNVSESARAVIIKFTSHFKSKVSKVSLTNTQ